MTGNGVAWMIEHDCLSHSFRDYFHERIAGKKKCFTAGIGHRRSGTLFKKWTDGAALHS